METFFPANLLAKYWKTEYDTTEANMASITKYTITQNKQNKLRYFLFCLFCVVVYFVTDAMFAFVV